jgi:hypothetical protein
MYPMSVAMSMYPMSVGCHSACQALCKAPNPHNFLLCGSGMWLLWLFYVRHEGSEDGGFAVSDKSPTISQHVSGGTGNWTSSDELLGPLHVTSVWCRRRAILWVCDSSARTLKTLHVKGPDFWETLELLAWVQWVRCPAGKTTFMKTWGWWKVEGCDNSRLDDRWDGPRSAGRQQPCSSPAKVVSLSRVPCPDLPPMFCTWGNSRHPTTQCCSLWPWTGLWETHFNTHPGPQKHYNGQMALYFMLL